MLLIKTLFTGMMLALSVSSAVVSHDMDNAETDIKLEAQLHKNQQTGILSLSGYTRVSADTPGSYEFEISEDKICTFPFIKVTKDVKFENLSLDLISYFPDNCRPDLDMIVYEKDENSFFFLFSSFYEGEDADLQDNFLLLAHYCVTDGKMDKIEKWNTGKDIFWFGGEYLTNHHIVTCAQDENPYIIDLEAFSLQDTKAEKETVKKRYTEIVKEQFGEEELQHYPCFRFYVADVSSEGRLCCTAYYASEAMSEPMCEELDYRMDFYVNGGKIEAEELTDLNLIKGFIQAVNEQDVESYIHLFCEAEQKSMWDYVACWGTDDFFTIEYRELVSAEKMPVGDQTYLSHEIGLYEDTKTYIVTEKVMEGYPQTAPQYTVLSAYIMVKDNGEWKLSRVVRI